MTSTSVLKRIPDGKLFKVTDLGHWSDIESEDGEKYRVKWLGGDGLYVGVRGPTFEVVKENG